MTIALEQIEQILGQSLVCPDDRKVGTVTAVFVDHRSKRPEWLVTRMGTIRRQTKFVPIEDAELVGGQIRVPFERLTIKGSPAFANVGESLTRAQKRELHDHYSVVADPTTITKPTDDASGHGHFTATHACPPRTNNG